MRLRVLAMTVALSGLLATTAHGLSPEELVGDYPVALTGEGPACAGHVERATFNVKSVTGGKITFGVNGSSFIEADLTSPAMTFHGSKTDGGNTVVFDGAFTRQADAVAVTMGWNNTQCPMRLNGSKPASHLEIAAAPAASPAAATAAPSILGLSPMAPGAPTGPASATAPPNPLVFYAPLALLLLAAGAGIGWFVARKREKPDG